MRKVLVQEGRSWNAYRESYYVGVDELVKSSLSQSEDYGFKSRHRY